MGKQLVFMSTIFSSINNNNNIENKLSTNFNQVMSKFCVRELLVNKYEAISKHKGPDMEIVAGTPADYY